MPKASMLMEEVMCTLPIFSSLLLGTINWILPNYHPCLTYYHVLEICVCFRSFALPFHLSTFACWWARPK
jgi:hypothetical protein